MMQPSTLAPATLAPEGSVRAVRFFTLSPKSVSSKHSAGGTSLPARFYVEQDSARQPAINSRVKVPTQPSTFGTLYKGRL